MKHLIGAEGNVAHLAPILILALVAALVWSWALLSLRAALGA